MTFLTKKLAQLTLNTNCVVEALNGRSGHNGKTRTVTIQWWRALKTRPSLWKHHTTAAWKLWEKLHRQTRSLTSKNNKRWSHVQLRHRVHVVRSDQMRAALRRPPVEPQERKGKRGMPVRPSCWRGVYSAASATAAGHRQKDRRTETAVMENLHGNSRLAHIWIRRCRSALQSQLMQLHPETCEGVAGRQQKLLIIFV